MTTLQNIRRRRARDQIAILNDVERNAAEWAKCSFPETRAYGRRKLRAVKKLRTELFPP